MKRCFFSPATWLAFVAFFSMWADIHAEEPVAWQRTFQTPVRLKADGKSVDSGKSWGHSGPTIADVDEDGLADLVVGDFSGFFVVYRNIGSFEKPVYAAGEKMQAGNKVAKVHVY